MTEDEWAEIERKISVWEKLQSTSYGGKVYERTIKERAGNERQEIEAAAEAIARAMPVGFIVTMEAAREFARAALKAARSVKP